MELEKLQALQNWLTISLRKEKVCYLLLLILFALLR
jgi:hypothetical protein